MISLDSKWAVEEISESTIDYVRNRKKQGSVAFPSCFSTQSCSKLSMLKYSPKDKSILVIKFHYANEPSQDHSIRILASSTAWICRWTHVCFFYPPAHIANVSFLMHEIWFLYPIRKEIQNFEPCLYLSLLICPIGSAVQ